MTKWLDDITEKAKNINPEMFKPGAEAGLLDDILGEVDERSKKFYALAKTYERCADKAREDANRLFTDAFSKQRLLEIARKTDQEANAIMGIFFASVKSANNLWGENIVIKKGWKIVRRTYRF